LPKCKGGSYVKKGGWEKELLGWDDGNVHVFHLGEAIFRLRDTELHDEMVEMVVRYFEESNSARQCEE
jgi:hypothetical protein